MDGMYASIGDPARWCVTSQQQRRPAHLPTTELTWSLFSSPARRHRCPTYANAQTCPGPLFVNTFLPQAHASSHLLPSYVSCIHSQALHYCRRPATWDTSFIHRTMGSRLPATGLLLSRASCSDVTEQAAARVTVSRSSRHVHHACMPCWRCHHSYAVVQRRHPLLCPVSNGPRGAIDCIVCELRPDVAVRLHAGCDSRQVHHREACLSLAWK